MNVVEWLLDSDPAIRWQVMRDLTDAPAQEVATERARIRLEGRGAAVEVTVLALEGKQPCAPTFFGDAGALGRNFLRRCIGKVAHDLPADRRVGIKQPLDDVHSLLPPPPMLGGRSSRPGRHSS